MHERFVSTTRLHNLQEDTLKMAYEMSRTSIIADVGAECVRMRGSSAHRTAATSTLSHQTHSRSEASSGHASVFCLHKI